LKMAGESDKKITVQVDTTGQTYTVIDSTGQIHRGTVVIKAVNCGKKCKGCPHKIYKYVAWRQDRKTRWKYIGKVTQEETNSGPPIDNAVNNSEGNPLN